MNDYAAADEGAREMLYQGVVAVGTVNVLMSLPSPVASTVGIISLWVSAENVKPHAPFARVAFACEEIAGRLDEIKNGGGDFRGLEPIAKKIKTEWEGPGAEAFDSYVTDELVPGIEALRKACEDLAPTYRATSDNMAWAIEGYFVLNGVNIVFQIALNIVLYKTSGTAAPVVMPAKSVATFLTGVAIFGLIWDVTNTLSNNAATSDELTGTMKDLLEKMAKKTDSIKKDALAMSKAELEDIKDPNEWAKE